MQQPSWMTGIPYARLIGPASIRKFIPGGDSKLPRTLSKESFFFRAVLGVQKCLRIFLDISWYLFSFWLCSFLSTCGCFRCIHLIQKHIREYFVQLGFVDDPSKKQAPRVLRLASSFCHLNSSLLVRLEILSSHQVHTQKKVAEKKTQISEGVSDRAWLNLPSDLACRRWTKFPSFESTMPQFDGGRSFQVKNTFIDVEESPKEGTLFSADTARRARSMPPPPMLDADEEDDSHDGTPVDDEVSSPTSLLGTHYSESGMHKKRFEFFSSRPYVGSYREFCSK